jgi:hypothetical protein
MQEALVAQIQPYAEAVGAEKIAPRLAAADVINLPRTQPDGSPWNVGGGRPVGEVLAEASGDYCTVELPPSTRQRLGELDDLSDEVRRDLERGFVEVSVAHLRDLPAMTRVRVGFKLIFTDSEIALLGL